MVRFGGASENVGPRAIWKTGASSDALGANSPAGLPRPPAATVFIVSPRGRVRPLRAVCWDWAAPELARVLRIPYLRVSY